MFAFPTSHLLRVFLQSLLPCRSDSLVRQIFSTIYSAAQFSVEIQWHR